MDGRGQVVQVPQPRYKAGFLGSISSVKINGVAVPPRAIYEHSGPAELMLEGENLTPDTLKLYHNGVLYTPLQSSDTYAYYLLGDNGTNKVMLNGKNWTTIIVKDVVVPEGLPCDMRMYLFKSNSVNFNNSAASEALRLDSASCINYSHVPNATYPYFFYSFLIDVEDMSDVAAVNASINNSKVEEGRTYLNLSVTDPTKPAYVTYQGFIIAVFNYSA